MSPDARNRFAAVAGAGVFVLALLSLLVVAEPARALLLALIAGVAGGLGVLALAAAAGPAAPVPVGRRVDRIAAEPAVPPPAPDLPPAIPLPDGLAPPPFIPGGLSSTGPSPAETTQISAEDLQRATDLHQTIRLDADSLQYALPDVSAEDILREREGIDEAFLKAGAGIDEPGNASENTGGGPPA